MLLGQELDIWMNSTSTNLKYQNFPSQNLHNHPINIDPFQICALHYPYQPSTACIDYSTFFGNLAHNINHQ